MSCISDAVTHDLCLLTAHELNFLSLKNYSQHELNLNLNLPINEDLSNVYRKLNYKSRLTGQ